VHIISMPNKTMCVERLASIQFERSDQTFNPARLINFLTNTTQISCYHI